MITTKINIPVVKKTLGGLGVATHRRELKQKMHKNRDSG